MHSVFTHQYSIMGTQDQRWFMDRKMHNPLTGTHNCRISIMAGTDVSEGHKSHLGVPVNYKDRHTETITDLMKYVKDFHLIVLDFVELLICY